MKNFISISILSIVVLGAFACSKEKVNSEADCKQLNTIAQKCYTDGHSPMYLESLKDAGFAKNCMTDSSDKIKAKLKCKAETDCEKLVKCLSAVPE